MPALPPIGLGTANLLKLPLTEFIEVSARGGFRRISARPYAFREALRQGHSEASLRRRLADAGIKVTMIDALNSGLPGMPSPDSLDAARRASLPPDALDPPDEAICLQTAVALGAGILNVVAYGGKIVPVEQMAEAVGGIAHRASAMGIRVGLEFVPESGIPDIGHAVRVIDACGGAGCGLTLDTFHLGRSGGTVEDVRRLAPRSIAGIQISDRRADQGAHIPFGGRLMPGDGDLPLVEMVAAALENSPDATVDIEVLNAELNGLPADEAARRLATASAAWRRNYEAG